MVNYFDGFCQQANGGTAKSNRKRTSKRDKGFLTRLRKKQASYGRISGGHNYE